VLKKKVSIRTFNESS